MLLSPAKTLQLPRFVLLDLFSAFHSQLMNSCHGQAAGLGEYFLLKETECQQGAKE